MDYYAYNNYSAVDINFSELSDSDNHTSSSLDYRCQNSPRSKNEWSRKQRRCYSRVLSGIKAHNKDRLRFLTLTTASGMRRDIQKSFEALVKRIRRLTPMILVKQGYLTIQDAMRFYGRNNLDKSIEFEYIRIRTGEGVSGVLHILFYGSYLPQKWLSDTWQDITRTASVVDIRMVKERPKNGQSKKHLASYCVNQYCSGQLEFLRYSCSYGWVFKGFVGWFSAFLRHYGYRLGLEKWDDFLKNGFVLDGYSLGDPPYWATKEHKIQEELNRYKTFLEIYRSPLFRGYRMKYRV